MTKSSLFRAIVVATIGTMICGTATLASAGGAAGRVNYNDITITKRMDKASPVIYGPGAAVTLNPQPLPPRQSGTVQEFGLQNSFSSAIKGIGEGLSTMARKQ